MSPGSRKPSPGQWGEAIHFLALVSEQYHTGASKLDRAQQVNGLSFKSAMHCRSRWLTPAKHVQEAREKVTEV
jgi:hypothetical protein